METLAGALREYAEAAARECVSEEGTRVPSCVKLEKYWQRPVENHVVEFVVVNGWAVSMGVLGWRWMQREGCKGMAGDRRYGEKLGRVLAALLAGFYCMQLYYKVIRDTGDLNMLGVEVPRALVWMAMPCHMYTLLAIATLISPRPYCNYLASLCVTASWNTFLGSAFADFDDQTHWSEGYTFIAHHATLNVLPLYFATSYPLHEFTPGWLAFSTCWITLLNMAVEMPLSYHSGYNINYHLHPPSKGAGDRIFGGDVYYKPKVILILVFLSTSSHLIVTFLTRPVVRFLERSAQKTKQN